MSSLPTRLACLSLCVLAALPAGADLNLALSSSSAGKKPGASTSPDRKPNPVPLELRTPRSEASAWSLGPQPAAIIRRSSNGRRAMPVLPPVNGAAVVPVAPPPRPELEVTAWLGKTLTPLTDVFRLPNPASTWVGRLKAGQQVAIVSQWQGWYAIVMADGSQAYLPQTHVQVQPFQVKTVIAAPEKAPTAAGPSEPSSASAVVPISWQEAATPAAQGVIREAFRYQGAPYVYGGNGEGGIDCSGLVRNCFASQGIRLPRRASEQAQVGESVPLNALEPGDRLYFSVRSEYDHAGIYLGNGYFIHAARSHGQVAVDRLASKLYARSLAMARR